MNSTSTVTKKIELVVNSPSAKLTGIEQADALLRKLNVTLEKTTVLTNNLGGNSFSHLGSQAEAASARAVNSINNIGRAARAAMADMNRINQVGGQSSRGGGGGNGRIGSWQHAISGVTPAGWARNSLTAIGWISAYQGVEKVTEVMEYSLRRSIELERQIAVMRQTFRSSGGSALELADDVLKLAAAEGRGTDEAMKSAIHWTRLGLSRSEAAEATRVSLVAANVAELSAAEATEQLSSLMTTYGLSASELNGTLGMLSRTSQTYRVTVGELLNGLSRVSNVAKESGMSLAQLQAIMGQLVQRTGVTGDRVANFLQLTLARLNNSNVQAFFERNYQTQLTGNYGDLHKIFQIYSKASLTSFPGERKAL